MINFKDRSDRAASGIILASLFVALGAIVIIVAVPAPTPAGTSMVRIQAIDALQNRMALDKQTAAITREQIMPRVWNQGQDVVSASILSQLTKQALSDSVVIAAFRPQHTTDLGGITELPFTVQVAGAYPGIHSLMTFLDKSNTSIVLKSAQIATSQAGSNGITATLGISAYLDDTVAAAPRASVKAAKHV